MFGINSLFIVEQALIIMALLFIFARQEADFEYSTVLLVTCGTIAGNAILALLLFEHLGIFVAIPVFFFTCWLLVKFCWVSWPKGLLITFLYFLIFIGIEVGKSYYQFGHLAWNFDSGSKTNAVQSTYEKNMNEGMDAVKELNQGAMRMMEAARGRATNLHAAVSTNNAVTMTNAAAVTATPQAAPLAGLPAAPPTLSAALTTPAPPPLAVPGVAPAATDWTMAKSQLRIRGWMSGSKNGRTAMVNDQMVSVGGEVFVDYNGLRYSWRLAALNGYQPQWEPLRATVIPARP